jgi:hypothetical protein
VLAPLPLPPYSLAAIACRFPALSALAGRAQLGGKREVAIAALMAARLSAALMPPHPVRAEARMVRAASARTWSSAFALPSGVRQALSKVFDATAGDDRDAVSVALARLTDAAAPHLDNRALAELRQLARALPE